MSGRRYRVLVVPEWYPSANHPFAGAFVREQVRALARAGHEVTVLASEDAHPRSGLLGTTRVADEHGVLVVRCRSRTPRPRQAATALKAAALRAGLDRVFAAGRIPEIVHAHVFSAGILALPLARRLKAPLVISEHYSGFARGTLSAWDKLLARRVFAAADLVAPVCDDLRAHIAALGAPARFAVVPNLIDTDLFRPDDSVRERDPATPARLLLVGGMTDVKGVPYALAALARLTTPAVLDIVGDGPRRSAYEVLTQRLGISAQVRWHGTRSTPEVAELMRAADLYVLASEWENLPTVVLEALACGVPVVATRVGGVPEIVGTDDGLLVSPRDAEELARGIVAALGTVWDSDAIARRAAERFGAASVVSRWEEIYAGLIEARR